MKDFSTSISSFDYFDGITEAWGVSSLSGEHDYAAGVIVYGCDRIPPMDLGMGAPANSRVPPGYQITPLMAHEIRKFATQLEPFVALREGWNGIDSSGPSANSVVMAIDSCLAILIAGIPSPRPKILSNGTLGGYWRAGNAYAAMDFEEDGEHVWTVTDGKSYASGTWKVGEILPKAIDNIAEDPQQKTLQDLL